MTLYAYVEDNEVKEVYNELPPNWKNISGFNHFATDTVGLQTHDWYIVKEERPNYDPARYTLSEPIFSFENQQVIARYTATEIVIEVDIPAELQRRFMILLREERERRLKASDWTMMTDVVKKQSEAWISAWEIYRQQLRDLPNQFTFSKTDLPPQIDTVTWPQQPEN